MRTAVMDRTVVDQASRLLMRKFPGWLCWCGPFTRNWWTLPPPDCWYPWLIEAATPEEMATRIHEIRAAAVNRN